MDDVAVWSVKIESRPGVLPIGGDDSGVDAVERIQSWVEDAHPDMGAVAGAGMDGSLSLRLAIDPGDAVPGAKGKAIDYRGIMAAYRIALAIFRAAVGNALGDDVDSRPWRVLIEPMNQGDETDEAYG